MRNTLYIFLTLVLSTALFAQATLNHDTGSIKVTVFNNGYIGHNDLGSGAGFVYDGNVDALFTGGLMIGHPAAGVNGMVGSFTSGSATVINDMVSTDGMNGFYSDSFFNQVADASFQDQNSASPLGLNVLQVSYSNTDDEYMFVRLVVRNNAGFTLEDVYVGMFADWDVGLNNYDKNRGGIDKARNLTYQYENGGAADVNYYGIVALNGLAGAKVTTASPFDEGDIRLVLYDWISAVDETPISADGDYRTYMGSGPYTLLDGQAVEVGFAFVAGKDLDDLKANAEDAADEWLAGNVPVELTSFNAMMTGSNVNLQWATATETNNQGFEIQRKIVKDGNESDWNLVAFKQGFGTTTEPQQYSYQDDISKLNADKIYYRLKQIDFDGRYEFTDEVFVENNIPQVFGLEQNYPNPFNPATKITFNLPEQDFVTLKVYNMIGEEVAELVNEMKEAGTYQVDFNAINLTSGTYLYVLKGVNNNSVDVKKMILVK